MSSNTIFKTDDTQAFGNNFLEIDIENPLRYEISKLVVVTNSGACIPNKIYTDDNNFTTENITLYVNYSSQETAKLNATNVLNVVAYDMQGRQITCAETYTFYAKNGVILKNGRCSC